MFYVSVYFINNCIFLAYAANLERELRRSGMEVEGLTEFRVPVFSKGGWLCFLVARKTRDQGGPERSEQSGFSRTKAVNLRVRVWGPVRQLLA